MTSEFLGGDVRRQHRPYMIVALNVALIFKSFQVGSSSLTMYDAVRLGSVAIATAAVGFFAHGRPESLKVDALLVVALYLGFDTITVLFRKGSLNPEHVGDLVACFASLMQIMVATGTHFGAMLCWFAAVLTVRELPEVPKSSIIVLGIQLLILHTFLQLSELRKHRESQEAQKSAARLRKLEHDRMKLRQERVEVCLGMVMHHLRAPLLLLKSEISVHSEDAELGPQALEALKSRVGQLWSIFSGLETQVLGELGEDLELDGLSASVRAGYQQALLPQVVDLPPRGQQAAAAAEAARPDGTEPGDPQALEEEEEEDLDCARALRQPQERTAAAEAEAPAGEEGPRPQGAGGGEAQHQASASAGAGEAGAAPPEGGEAPFDRVLSPRGVRVVYDPTDPNMGISALSFLFADGPEGDAPGLLSLLPHCRGDFALWVQGQVNDIMHSMAEGGGAITFQAAPDRVALALPSVRMMLQQLLLHPATFCEASLAFRGLEEVGSDGQDGSDDNSESVGDGSVQAILELSELTLPRGAGPWPA